jgi:heat shock protein HspQ
MKKGFRFRGDLQTSRQQPRYHELIEDDEVLQTKVYLSTQKLLVWGVQSAESPNERDHPTQKLQFLR